MKQSSIEIINQSHFEELYSFYSPASALQQWVEFYWQLDLRQQTSGNTVFNETILANLNSSLVFNLGSAFDIREQTGNSYQPLKNSVLIGLRTRPVAYRHHAGNLLVGVKFKPLGIQKFFNVEAAELNNSLLNSTDLLRERYIDEQLYHMKGLVERAAWLDQLLLKEMQHARDTYRFQLVWQALNSRQLAACNYQVQQVAALLHLNKRSLERYFNAVIGLGPKTCLSIIRFRNGLSKYASGQPGTESDEWGYTDFSHFLKDFRKYSLTSPGRKA